VRGVEGDGVGSDDLRPARLDPGRRDVAVLDHVHAASFRVEQAVAVVLRGGALCAAAILAVGSGCMVMALVGPLLSADAAALAVLIIRSPRGWSRDRAVGQYSQQMKQGLAAALGGGALLQVYDRALARATSRYGRRRRGRSGCARSCSGSRGCPSGRPGFRGPRGAGPGFRGLRGAGSALGAAAPRTSPTTVFL